jgi:imidazolonepropionase-like amidohydrolase
VNGTGVLSAPRVFDGKRLLDGPHQVRIEDGRISAVVPVKGSRDSASFGDTTILPGLVDAHVHLVFEASPDINALVQPDTTAAGALRSAANARLHLAAGVTTVRDLGSPDGIVVDVASSVGTPLLPDTPGILATGQVLTVTGGHGYFMRREVDGEDAFRRGVRAEIKRGAGAIKVIATGGVITRQGLPGATATTLDELRAAVEEAHNAGLRVAAHAHGTEGIKRAIEAGVDTIEHASYLDDKALELFLEHGAWMVSTLLASERLMPHLEDPAMPAHVREKIQDHTAREAASLEWAVTAGVRIAAGTDAGTGYNPHGGLPEQVSLLERHGMSREHALAAATAGSAQAIGLADSAGRIAAGYPADLLVVNGDPLVDLAALQDVGAVYVGGRLIEPVKVVA